MSLTISAGVATDVGRVRAVNEDSFCSLPRMYAVADGMGGHAAGDRASRIAVDALTELAGHPAFDLADIHRSLAEANQTMVVESESIDAPRGMGTTVAGLAVVAVAGTDHWAVFNIGDSRVYQWETGVLTQISVDHSEVQELIAAGRLDPSAAATYPRRNVVTRSLGVAGVESADTWLLPMGPGQLFLICSDGLTGELTDAEIAGLLTGAGTPTELAERLVAGALEAGGHDNVTVLVVRTEAAAEVVEDTNPQLNVSELRDARREGQS